MPDDAKRAGLLRAAKYMLAEVKRRAPTERSAQSFYISEEGEDLIIESRDPGTIATERGFRHPLFGDDSHWYGPSGRQVGRRYFIEAGSDAALNHAAEAFADEWANVFTRSSSTWEADE